MKGKKCNKKQLVDKRWLAGKMILKNLLIRSYSCQNKLPGKTFKTFQKKRTFPDVFLVLLILLFFSFYRFTVSVIDISFKFSFCIAFSDVISKSLLVVVMMMMMSLSNTSVLYFMVLLSSVTDPQSQLLRKHLMLLWPELLSCKILVRTLWTTDVLQVMRNICFLHFIVI